VRTLVLASSAHLERQRKAVDDGAQDLEQLRHAVVAVGLEDEGVEDVIDGTADEVAVDHELAVDSEGCRRSRGGGGKGFEAGCTEMLGA